MRQVKNHLEPSAQPWVREVESSIQSIEKLTAGISESDRSQGVVLDSITGALAEIRNQQDLISAQQDLISAQQDLMALNASYLTFQFPVLTTTGSNIKIVPLTEHMPNWEEFSGIVTFTVIPNPSVTSGVVANGSLTSLIFRDNKPLIAVPKLEFEVNGTTFSGQNMSLSLEVAKDNLPRSISLSTDYAYNLGPSHITMSGILLVTFNLSPRTP